MEAEGATRHGRLASPVKGATRRAAALAAPLAALALLTASGLAAPRMSCPGPKRSPSPVSRVAHGQVLAASLPGRDQGARRAPERAADHDRRRGLRRLQHLRRAGAEPPTFDALAAEGAKYNGFNTAAICSPTRAALLTGRNQHRAGMAMVPEAASGYDGYDSIVPRADGTIAQVLKAGGYNTAVFGKWHLTPTWEQSAAGPQDHWPTNMGFEYFYGFLGGEVNQFAPKLMEGTTPIEPALGVPGYHLDRDLADHAIRWINRHEAAAPDKPFFIYYAPGTSHSPHDSPADWTAKFKGRFDRGWDVERQAIFARQKQLGIITRTPN